MKFPLFVLFLFLLISCKNGSKDQATNHTAPSQSTTKNIPSKSESVVRGKRLYSQFCLQCHMPSGQGLIGVFPPLANSDWLSEKRSASLHAVKYGLSGEITVNGTTYNNVMPLMGLSDQEVADVLNYVMTSWGNTQKTPVTEEEVSKITE